MWKPCEGCPEKAVRKANLEVKMLGVINLILGGALLLAGRKLFWLFVGAAGFLTGMQLATRFWQGPDLLAIIVGLVIGVIFALLAIFLQALVIGIAGFLIGGYVLTVLATMLSIDVTGVMTWVIYAVGGVSGLILVSFLFDWAIITLSSLAGASLIIQSVFPQGVQSAAGGILFFILFIIGVLIQGSILRRERAAAVVVD